MKMMVEIDYDQVDDLIRDRLRIDYIDQVTVWKDQSDSKELSEALLEVIKYYSAPDEFEEWYESVKEL